MGDGCAHIGRRCSVPSGQEFLEVLRQAEGNRMVYGNLPEGSPSRMSVVFDRSGPQRPQRHAYRGKDRPQHQVRDALSCGVFLETWNIAPVLTHPRVLSLISGRSQQRRRQAAALVTEGDICRSILEGRHRFFRAIALGVFPPLLSQTAAGDDSMAARIMRSGAALSRAHRALAVKRLIGNAAPIFELLEDALER